MITADDVLRRYNSETLPEFCEPLTDVNQAGTFGNRPIHLASYRGNMDDLTALVTGGADVNALGDLGTTALHEATSQGHGAAVVYLLAQGATLQRDEMGQTPIDIARRAGQSEILRLLTVK